MDDPENPDSVGLLMCPTLNLQAELYALCFPDIKWSLPSYSSRLIAYSDRVIAEFYAG